MSNLARSLEDVLEDASQQLHNWYDNLEFSSSGLWLYGVAFGMFMLPLIIFGLEWLFGKHNKVGKGRLPAASKNLPIPKPMKIKELRVYPIKSCRGFIVKEAKILTTGLELDRNWMFVDAKSMKFLTIRQVSEMTLIDTKLSLDRSKLHVSVRGKPNIRFEVDTHPSQDWLKKNTTLSEVEIWGDKTDGWMYSEAMTAPFSEFLGKDVRFVYKGPTRRDLPKQARPEILGRIGSTKFADFMPVLVANQRSIEELNTRLKAGENDEITIERFRPNIVVEGFEAWQEDVWKTLRVGGVELDIPVRCARCQVPNVDPDTGVKNAKQPWDTLMKYRRIDQGINFKPIFGVLCVPRGDGLVQTGEMLEVVEVTEEHNYKGVA